MSDVRSLLRSARASRRITHPQASYTSDGKLLCNICHLHLKSETLWEPHLQSRGHKIQENGRAQASINTDGKGSATRKRKASDDDNESGDARKRSKPVKGIHLDEDPPSGPGTPETLRGAQLLSALDQNTDSMTPEPASNIPVPVPPQPTPPLSSNSVTIDEAEWAAFEREVATSPPTSILSVPHLPPALTSTATITADPISASDLATRAAEDASQQRTSRTEAEMEGEAEDAKERLAEELEQMEEYEERVRKLKEKREEIRAKRKKEIEMGGTTVEVDVEPGLNGASENSGSESDDEDEGDDYEWGDWGEK
ncbi:MAG: hypothetical protein M1834_001711 [Cirrosporium novae-zelandiae]|nr:MAG: hypothetical protein M1834_001711 [Cirrosporium novae-zelandiae]